MTSRRGPSEALNTALALAAGEFVGLVEPDGVLQPDALYQVAKFLNHERGVDFIYTDEDESDENGQRSRPVFKPDWSPELLLSMNYVGHLSVIRRRLVERVGGFRQGFDTNPHYDLFLRVVEHTERIRRIARPLYSRRASPGPPRPSGDAMQAHGAGRRAIEDALARRGIRARVEDGLVTPLRYRICYVGLGEPKVSIVIPTRDRRALLEQCVRSIETRTTYRNFEIVIVDNRSRDPATRDYLAHSPHRVIRVDEQFNFSRINNLASVHAAGEILVFLNNDTEVISSEWLRVMVEHAARPEIGAVGAKLLYPDGTIQHAGVVVGRGGFAWNAFRFLPAEDPGYCDLAMVIRDCSAVTAACLAARRKVFLDVGGFDENIAVAFGDVDLCLRLREKGYRIVWTPYALLYHHESASRGALHPKSDERYVCNRWKGVLEAGDPHYNPNLSPLNFGLPWTEVTTVSTREEKAAKGPEEAA